MGLSGPPRPPLRFLSLGGLGRLWEALEALKLLKNLLGAPPGASKGTHILQAQSGRVPRSFEAQTPSPPKAAKGTWKFVEAPEIAWTPPEELSQGLPGPWGFSRPPDLPFQGLPEPSCRAF